MTVKLSRGRRRGTPVSDTRVNVGGGGWTVSVNVTWPALAAKSSAVMVTVEASDFFGVPVIAPVEA